MAASAGAVHQGALPDRAIRAQLDLAIRDSGDRLARYTERMLGGGMDVLSWRAAMQRELAVGHRLATVLARGGVAQMGPADWQAAGEAASAPTWWCETTRMLASLSVADKERYRQLKYTGGTGGGARVARRSQEPS